jgi:Di-haem oxidoreductase, putative peroxidase
MKQSFGCFCSSVRVLLLVPVTFTCALAQPFHPIIPRAWDDREVAGFEVPLAQPDRSPRYLSAAEYYALEVMPIYRSYPVYAPGREPAGYIESLKQKEPEIAFDPATLRTEEDWIRAGAIVFRAARDYPPNGVTRFAEAIRSVQIPATREGIVPFVQYVVRKKGVVELGIVACANCHTRVLPDGTAVDGAQGSFPFARRDAWQANNSQRPDRDQLALNFELKMYGAPWVETPGELYATTAVERIRRLQATQTGVIPREGASSAFPVHVPSLIGIKDIRYLDATGLTRHRSIADLMRYAIVNQGVEGASGNGLQMSAQYGDFQPENIKQQRYSDEQLYALALYLYSLQPPPNPNPSDDNARRGQRIFQQQGCPACHTPPLYTNNRLTPAAGFRIPEPLRKTDEILDISVGTDPSLATRTRRGTGFYKVPSLRGVWYRNAFGHMGQAETLEEWFDPARLNPDYVPKGFHLAPGPIKGHEFGLKLSANDKRTLIAFLKTL